MLATFLDYGTLRVIWWALLGILLIGFAVTDGYDLGTGILLPWVARSDAERRLTLEAIEPHWEGHQVWFILGGGASFAAWPALYGASFSGFYIAMLLVLGALILRPVGFNFRNKVEAVRWREAWDWALFAGGLVPALVFGVAFGNLLQGVPFRLDQDLRSSYEGSFFALLNPFALLAGLVSIAMLTMHGAMWLALKTDGMVEARARAASVKAALAALVLFLLAGLWVAFGIEGYALAGAVAGALLGNYHSYPWTLLAPALGCGGALLAALMTMARHPLLAFLASALGIAGIIATAGLALFPFLLPSSIDLASSLTVWDASSSRMTLLIMLAATLIFLPLILLYTGWAMTVMRGRLKIAEIDDHENAY